MIFTITHIFKKRWLFSCLLFFCTGCMLISKPPEKPVKVNNRIAQAAIYMDSIRLLAADGDIITRTGNDFTSQSLKQFSQTDPTYSHCGIIRIEGDSLFVYHAVGGEFNPDQQLKKDPLSVFCDATQNEAIGLFRFPLTNEIKIKLDSLIQDYFSRKIPFDMNFDLATDDKMYCTEFVAKILNRASEQEFVFDTSEVNSKKYIAVDNIFLNKKCREIMRFEY